jgi:hypothetical protein
MNKFAQGAQGAQGYVFVETIVDIMNASCETL